MWRQRSGDSHTARGGPGAVAIAGCPAIAALSEGCNPRQVQEVPQRRDGCGVSGPATATRLAAARALSRSPDVRRSLHLVRVATPDKRKKCPGAVTDVAS